MSTTTAQSGRRTWPLFTRAAASASTQQQSRASQLPLKLLTGIFCAFLVITPLALLPLGAPQPAKQQYFWIRGPQHLLQAAQRTFLGKYSAKPAHSHTSVPNPIRVEDYNRPDGERYSTGLSVPADAFHTHQPRYSTGFGTSVQAFFSHTAQSLSSFPHRAQRTLLALPGSMAISLGIAKPKTWSQAISHSFWQTQSSISRGISFSRWKQSTWRVHHYTQALLQQSATRLQAAFGAKPGVASTRSPLRWLSDAASSVTRTVQRRSWWDKGAVGRALHSIKAQGRRLFQQPSTWYKAMRAHLSKGWSLSRRIIKAAVRKLRTTAVDFWDLVGPGGKLHPEEFIEHNGDVLVQLLLGAVVAYLAVQKSFKPSAKYDAPLTEQETEQLCKEWQPEPLVEARAAVDGHTDAPVIIGRPGVKVHVEGRKDPLLNMVSNDFLGLSGNSSIERQCAATIEKYGVGSCGPRAFYGTIDVHLTLEAKLAQFMGTEECIIYSYDMATVPSVIPAFANAKDVIICDEAAGYAVQNGCVLSRARIHYFKHNDLADLERILTQVDADHRRKKKPLNRRFIVTEGIFAATGELAPLKAIHDLKTRFKYRLIVDESFALGVLGQHGRGACEHFGLQPGEVEIVCASLGNSLGSVGGMCVGTREVVDHQRLSGYGYCFSASLPPFLATAACVALEELQEASATREALCANARSLHEQLSRVAGLSLLGESHTGAPLVHLVLDPLPETNGKTETQVIQQIADTARELGVLVGVHRTSPLDRWQQRPSLRLTVSAKHTENDLKHAVSLLSAAVQQVLHGKPKTQVTHASPPKSPTKHRRWSLGGGKTP